MMDFIWAGGVSVVLVLISTIVFYEILANVWLLLAKLKTHPRSQIILTIVAMFLGHTIVVWLFGISYYLMEYEYDLGTLKGNQIISGLFQYVYFSSVTYSSLGLGDVYPTRGLQLVMGVESLLGLILIGWSITFTYVVTQQYLIHRSGKNHPLLRK